MFDPNSTKHVWISFHLSIKLESERLKKEKRKKKFFNEVSLFWKIESLAISRSKEKNTCIVNTWLSGVASVSYALAELHLQICLNNYCGSVTGGSLNLLPSFPRDICINFKKFACIPLWYLKFQIFNNLVFQMCEGTSIIFDKYWWYLSHPIYRKMFQYKIKRCQ